MNEWLVIALLPTLLAGIRVSVPLIFAAMGGLLSERSGVINIALEGLMLMGAFFAAITAHYTHSPWLGMLAGAMAGMALASIYALFVLVLKSDQIVAGMAINILAMGIPPFINKILFDNTGSTPSLDLASRFQIAPVFVCAIVIVIIYYWYRYTPSGLWVRFAGENPEALEASGKSVYRIRWAMVLASGVLAGMGGASLSLFLASAYSRNMTAGRGFMALAALIFGKWKPIPAALACLFVGFTDALQMRLQGMTLAGTEIPVQFIQILPYVVTVVVLAGFVGSSRPPAALGSR